MAYNNKSNNQDRTKIKTNQFCKNGVEALKIIGYKSSNYVELYILKTSDWIF